MAEITEADLWRLAHQVMTVKQLEVYMLWIRDGLTQAQIALALGISRQAVRDRLDGGKRRLLENLKEAA